jgi:hypothetical protein
MTRVHTKRHITHFTTGSLANRSFAVDSLASRPRHLLPFGTGWRRGQMNLGIESKARIVLYEIAMAAF